MPVSLLSLLTTFALLLNEAGASDATFDLAKVMTESVNSVKADIFSVLAIVIPVMVAITGAIVGVTFGRKWLKKLAN